MTNLELLELELERNLETIKVVDVDSPAYTNALERIETLVQQIAILRKGEEAEERLLEEKRSNAIKATGEKRSGWIRIAETLAGLAVGAGVSIWATKSSREWETEGNLHTTQAGKEAEKQSINFLHRRKS